MTVIEVTEGRLTPALFGIGTVEARRSYLIGPTTAGRVRKVAVDVGDTVKAGQLLAEMDPVDLDERLAALDASIARAGSAAAAVEAQRKDALRQEGTGGHQRASLRGSGREEFHQCRRRGGQAAGADLGRRRRECAPMPTWLRRGRI